MHQDAPDSKTMLKQLTEMPDSVALKNAREDPDAQPLTRAESKAPLELAAIPGATLLERFRQAQKRDMKQAITVRYDADIVRYYKAKGKGYQSIMNAALRACMEVELEAAQHQTH